MFAFSLKRQQAATGRQNTQTFTPTFDCFSLQIGILLCYKVTVILKDFASHYRGWYEETLTGYTTR